MPDYNDSVDYLKKAALRGSRLGLERISELMERLDNPQNRVKTIHVAGTNGKGSFGAMLTSILTEAGYTVGGFSSPALTGITDSFRINCREITKKDFAEVMTEIIPHCEAMEDKPTEFEVLTAAAYLLFFRKGCNISVVECGMGGDTDSTNVLCFPLLSVITNVQKDHTAFLGETIEEIARHKAGIIKCSRPVIYGGTDLTVSDLILREAKKKCSEFYSTDYFRVSDTSSDLSGTEFSFDGMGDFRMQLLGKYQVMNAATVLTAVEVLRGQRINIPDEAVRRGLEKARWHGRFEVVRREPYVIYDGAHNPDGIRSAAESIELYFRGSDIVLLIGVMADKEYGLYTDMLGSRIRKAFTVTPDNPRALASDKLAEVFRAADIDAEPFDDLAKGVCSAYEYAKANDLPLIALGSLYMYGDFMDALNNITE